MAQIIDRKGYESIMEGYEFHTKGASTDEPIYFSVWANNKLKHASQEADPEEAKEEFSDIMKAYDANHTTGEIEVRFHPGESTKSVKNTSDYCASMICKLYLKDERIQYKPLDGPMNVPQYQQPDPLTAFLKQYEAFLAIQSKLSPEPTLGAMGNDAPKDIWDRVESLMLIPSVENAINGLVAKVLGQDLNSLKNTAMAGDNTIMPENEIDMQSVDFSEIVTDEEQQLQLMAVLHRLQKGEKDFIGLLVKLADLKETNPGKYNMAKMFL